MGGGLYPALKYPAVRSGKGRLRHQDRDLADRGGEKRVVAVKSLDSRRGFLNQRAGLDSGCRLVRAACENHRIDDRQHSDQDDSNPAGY